MKSMIFKLTTILCMILVAFASTSNAMESNNNQLEKRNREKEVIERKIKKHKDEESKQPVKTVLYLDGKIPSLKSLAENAVNFKDIIEQLLQDIRNASILNNKDEIQAKLDTLVTYILPEHQPRSDNLEKYLVLVAEKLPLILDVEQTYPLKTKILDFLKQYTDAHSIALKNKFINIWSCSEYNAMTAVLNLKKFFTVSLQSNISQIQNFNKRISYNTMGLLDFSGTYAFSEQTIPEIIHNILNADIIAPNDNQSLIEHIKEYLDYFIIISSFSLNNIEIFHRLSAVDILQNQHPSYVTLLQFLLLGTTYLHNQDLLSFLFSRHTDTIKDLLKNNDNILCKFFEFLLACPAISWKHKNAQKLDLNLCKNKLIEIGVLNDLQVIQKLQIFLSQLLTKKQVMKLNLQSDTALNEKYITTLEQQCKDIIAFMQEIKFLFYKNT